MNLHGLVRGAIVAINPDIIATLLPSAGYTTDAAYKQVPAYGAPVTARIQVQALTGKDLQQTDNLNIQGVLRAVYMFGNWNGIVRADAKGGDMLKFPQTPGGAVQDWLAVAVLESWPDWTKLAVWLQT